MKLTYWQMTKVAILFKKTFNSIPKPMKLKKSWITSLFGASGLATIAYNTLSMVFDADPLTNPDWSVVISQSIVAFGLLFAKDFNQSNAAHPMETSKPV